VGLMLLSLSSCFSTKDNDEVAEAKRQLWIISEDTNSKNLDNNPIDEIDTSSNEEVVSEKQDIKEKNIEIINMTPDVFLEFDSLDWVNLLWWEVEIKWTTLATVDEIRVEFSNKTSDYPNDNYKLQTFKPWDKDFKYRAFSNYETLDFWINEYIFTATSGTKESKTKIILRAIKEEEKTSEISNNNFLWDLDFDALPIWENFWEPKQIWDWKITYSDIKWLEIEQRVLHNFDCSKNPETDNYYISELLDERINSYYWWNTCRPFWNNEWVSFFVLKLDENNYIYEKHIYLNNWVHWVYELEKWEDIVWDDDDSTSKIAKLQEKNNELKEKNNEFTIIEIVNDLFTQILYNLKK
jgi:hypothetical protein